MEDNDLVQLVCWLANIVTQQQDVRLEAMALEPEECREYIMFNFPTVQGSSLRAKLKRLGAQEVDHEALKRALNLLTENLKN